MIEQNTPRGLVSNGMGMLGTGRPSGTFDYASSPWRAGAHRCNVPGHKNGLGHIAVACRGQRRGWGEVERAGAKLCFVPTMIAASGGTKAVLQLG